MAEAAYLVLAAHLNPWVAALITGALTLLPLGGGVGALQWR